MSPVVIIEPVPLIALLLVPPVKVKPSATLFVIPLAEASKSALEVKAPPLIVILSWLTEAVFTISPPVISKAPLPLIALALPVPAFQINLPLFSIRAFILSEDVVNTPALPITTLFSVIVLLLVVFP